MKVISMRGNDKLEDFIWKNRGDMDTGIPSKNIWNKIESDLNGSPEDDPKKPSMDTGKWIFLSAIVLALTAYAFFQMGNKRGEQKAMLFAEIKSMEQHYEIQTQNLIRTVGGDFDMLQYPDLEDIDTHITEIKNELELLPESSEERALHALMESYETKLMILKSIMSNYEIAKPKNNRSEYNI